MRALVALGMLAGIGVGAHSWVVRRRATCPLGYGVATPAQHDAARLAFSKQHGSHTLARARPALGWAFDVTTRSELEAWVERHHVTCTTRPNRDLECTHVPLDALPERWTPLAVSALWLGFGKNDTLDHVTAFRATADAARAADALQALGSLLDEAGSKSASTGRPTAAWLSHGLLAQSRAEYSFSTYWACLTATQMAADRYEVIDEYRSLASP